MKKLLSLAAAGLCSASVFSHVHAHQVNPAVIERLTGESVEIHDHKEEAQEDPRGEERTFASFPEWYIVYNAQEYGRFVSGGGAPSAFPYFVSIGQYWESVDHAKVALRGKEIDSVTQTVLRVIGASFSVENAMIGLYEKTVGRLFDVLNLHIKTKEDFYTQRVAEEYGAFLLHTPWYEFPYGQKLAGLWATYGWSSLTPRGMERRTAFTIGYGIKGIYGAVLGWLSQTSLGSAELQTVFETEGISVNALEDIEGVEIEEQWSDGHIRAIAPRYRAFTRVAEEIARQGGTFLSIQDHDTIMLTILASETNECLSVVEKEFSMPILTQEGMSRIAITTDVSELASILTRIASCGLETEHVYDY